VQVSPAYFDVLRIPLTAGRGLAPAEAEAVLLNEALAKSCCGGTAALGQVLTLRNASRHVVGIVADAGTGRSALSGFLRGQALQGSPRIYERIQPEAVWYPAPVLLRDPDAATVQSLVALARRVDPQMRVDVTTLAEARERVLFEPVMQAWLAGVLGALALAMASVGIFGVFAYVGQRRVREIGVRMALGARPGQVLRGVFGTAARAITLGLGAGIALAAVAAHVLQSQVPAVSPVDPVTYGRVTLVLIATAAAATYVPARRATRVDPMAALRCE
jgi:hypothetical protein